MPFRITWNNYVVSVLEYVCMIYGTYWFTDVEPTCESRILLPQLPHTKMTCMHHDMRAPPHSFCLTQLLKRESQVWCAVKPHHNRVLGLGQRPEVYCDAMGRQEKVYFSFLSYHFFCSSYPWYPSFSFLLFLLLLFHKRFYFFMYAHVCAGMSICYVCSSILETRRGPRSAAGATGCREQLHMGIESRTGVLWKSNGCSEPLSYRSSPSTLCAHACSSCVCVCLDAMRE